MVTIEEVLRCWRKYSLWPQTQIRCKSGQMGEVLGLAFGKDDQKGQLTVRLDGGTQAIMERQDLFPIWWPEEEWAPQKERLPSRKIPLKNPRLAKALMVYGATIKAEGWEAGEPVIAKFSEEFMDFREMAWAVAVVLRAEEIIEEEK